MMLSMGAATLVLLPFVINRKAKEISDGGPRQVASGCKDRSGMHAQGRPARWVRGGGGLAVGPARG